MPKQGNKRNTGHFYRKLVSKTPEFSGIHSMAAIDKTALSFDRENHTMTWKVEANKYFQSLWEVKITDTLPKGHDFIEIKDLTITNADGSSFAMDSYQVTEGEESRSRWRF